ncbi:DNA utilization protein GntX, partial [Serratia rubidaea]
AAQQRLTARQRRRNLRGAFRCDEDLAGRHVALLDDVVTTGSTAAEIAALLQAQGVASLQIWCICRTL